MGITKLDVAEREIIAAVRLFFDGGDTVPVYVLAASAREIVTTLCKEGRIRGFFDQAQEEFPAMPKAEMYRQASRHAGFFKHADRDPEAKLTDFTDTEAEMALFVAVFDFGCLCKGKSIEAQVFEGWFLTLHGNPADTPIGLDDMFPNLRTLPRYEQIELGKRVLEWARTVPGFKMTYSLEFKPAA